MSASAHQSEREASEVFVVKILNVLKLPAMNKHYPKHSMDDIFTYISHKTN